MLKKKRVANQGLLLANSWIQSLPFPRHFAPPTCNACIHLLTLLTHPNQSSEFCLNCCNSFNSRATDKPLCLKFIAVTAKEIPKLLKRFARYDPDGRSGGITLKQFLDIPEISTNLIMPKVASTYLESRSNKITSSSFINMLSRLSPRNSLDDRKECELVFYLYGDFPRYQCV